MTVLRAFAVVLSLSATPALADEAGALKSALSVAATKDWGGALAITSGVGQDIIEWQRLRSGDGTLSDYEGFLTRHPDWPGLPLMVEKGEVAVARSTSPTRITAYFANTKPATGAGAVALVSAYMALGQVGPAEAEAMRAWANLPFSPQDETALLAMAPDALALVHEVRLDRLLWQDRRAEALRMIPRMSQGWAALAAARMALRAQGPGTTQLVNAVPAAFANDAGLAFERFQWRMKKDLRDDALALLTDRSASATSLGDPAMWADRRAVLARALMREGRATEAYRTAANHHLTSGADYADLEFLSGFIALRKLNDPTRALTHFQRLEAAVSTPISLSRALYWQGRALDAAGQPSTPNYTKAAAYQTAYYGLLASEKLGLPLSPALIAESAPPDWRTAAFAQSSVMQAGLLLLKAGDRTLAKRFFLHLSESLGAGELDQLSDAMLQLREPHIAVLIGKAAAERGIILPRAYYPVPAFVPDGLAVSRALALAISRRESEFDPAARSPADARGLMQVLPGTAKLMATKLGLPYVGADLTVNPGYNVKLGAAYLAQMAEEFGPSVALIASGYNAGPGRPRRWITEFGDPRRADVDVIDWVETIPFTETRTYVMRVVEGVVIYRAKLRGAAGPVKLSAELKG